MNFDPQGALETLRHSLEHDALANSVELAFEMAERGCLPVIELFSVAELLSRQGQRERAIALYRNWLAHTASGITYAVLFNLAVSLTLALDQGAAEVCYRQALTLKPDFIEAHVNLGSLLEQGGRIEDALAAWRGAVALARADVPSERALKVQALNSIGRRLEIEKRLNEAEQALTASLLLDPAQTKVMTHVVHLRQKQCAWPIYCEIAGVSEAELRAATSALAMLGLSNDPALQLAAARSYVDEKILPPQPPLADLNGYGHRKLRIGYLSSDLHSHAVGILTAELYELHDRARFEVYAFCWTNEDGTPLRARIVGAMDHLVRIVDMNDLEAAQCIRAHEIDILVDLHGLTSGTRPNILSYRPAPLQLTYIGFPGPTALPGVDYVIADRYVLPDELRAHFSEQPLYMPRTFQINDRKRMIGFGPTRANCALPEHGFVFCAFNNSHKITADMFACWMRILRRVPGSVLWLVADNDTVRSNLRGYAEQADVDPARLLFAGRTGPLEYLARYQLADLFLDCFPFNAGTTASDALWAGLPLLTYSGLTFASRMAGSLLQAVDLPDLITTSLAEYEEKAVALAHDPARIEAMKRQLIEQRFHCALFDSAQFVRDLETLYLGVAKGIAAPADAALPAQRWPAHTPIEQPNRAINFLVQTLGQLTDAPQFRTLMQQAVALVEPGYHLGDGLFTWGRNNSPFEDKTFVKAWESNIADANDRAIAWRRYMLACAAYHCAHLDGDFVECGVGQGSGIKIVLDYFGENNFVKTFWGYDRFDDDAHHQAVAQRLENHPQARLVRGELPGALAQTGPQRIAYLHLDLNNADADVAVLDALFERVCAGGLVILDDYERAGTHRPQKLAADAWFEPRHYRVFALPTGQGMVIKR